MIPIIGFVGEKKSGKTSVLQKVINHLSEKGYKIGVIKHTAHGFRLDYPETDSFKLYEAGARKIAVSGHSQLGIYGEAEPELGAEQIRDLFLSEMDLILVEGYRNASIPKVLVALSQEIPEWAKGLGGLIAIISKDKPDFEIKHFLPEQVQELAKLVEEYIKRHRGKREVKIYLDGRELKIKSFIKDFFLNTLSGMIGSLKQTQGAKRVQITIYIPDGIVEKTTED